MTDDLDGRVRFEQAREWLRKRWGQEWPNEAHCQQLADYADHLDALRRATDVGEAPAWLTNCCQCGRVVDTREQHEGGDPHGARWSEDAEPGDDWVCSSECWDHALAQDKAEGE